MSSYKIQPSPVSWEGNIYGLIEKHREYFVKYKIVDEKGNYLHWDKFRWKVESGDDQKIAWTSVKIQRGFIAVDTLLKDEKEKAFKYCIPDSLQSQLHKIMKIVVGDVSRAIDETSSFQKEFLVSSLIMEEVISSSQLEGATTTRRVAKKMLVTEREPRDESEQMIFNNYHLMEKAKETADVPLSIELIREFHRLATEETTHNSVIPGEFRKDNEIRIVDGVEGDILHQPPDFKLLSKRVKSICEFANMDHSGDDGSLFIDPIIKAIILHFMIGYEHPFSDENGRTARALFYWYLLKNNYGLFEYISISKLLKNAPVQYGNSYLYTETDDNDLTYFIYYQVEVILRAITELLEYLKEKTEDHYEIMKLLKYSKIKDKLKFVQQMIIKKAIKTPGRMFSVKEIKNDFSVSENTARKYLNELVKLKLLAAFKDGKTVRYIAPANLKDNL